MNFLYFHNLIMIIFKRVTLEKFLVLAVFVAGFFLSCNNKKAAEEDEQEKLITYLLNTSSIQCPEQTPTFATLSLAGTSSCGTSGCHDDLTKSADLDINVYLSVKAKTVPGDPMNSILYQAIATGSMKDNSNNTINTAVYCWIKGGSSP